jgi:hypothetical protein
MTRLGQEEIQLRKAILDNAILQKKRGRSKNCKQDCKNVRLQNEHQVEKTQVEDIRLEQMQSILQDMRQ